MFATKEQHVRVTETIPNSSYDIALYDTSYALGLFRTVLCLLSFFRRLAPTVQRKRPLAKRITKGPLTIDTEHRHGAGCRLYGGIVCLMTRS